MSKFFNYMKKFLTLSFILTISAFCLSLNCIASDTNIPNSPIGSGYAVQGAEAMRSYTDPETGNSFTLHTRHPEGQEPERYAVWHWNKKEEKTIVVPREVISMGEKYPLRGIQSSATMIAPVVLDVDCFNMTVDSTVSLDQRSLPNVLKVIIRNIDNATSDTQNVTELEDQNKTVSDLLEANSLTGNSAVYLTKDDGKNVYIGESDLFYADDDERVVTPHGLRYDWDEENEKWILTSFPNIQNLIIPAAFVDSNDLSLEKIEGVIVNDRVKTDKIQKIIVTNIQDDAHKEKILKFAGMILPGLENNVDDGEEWTVEDEVSSTGRLTFIKAQRQLMPVINKTVSAIALWAQTKPWNRLDKNGILREFKSIVDRDFEKAPIGAIELKDYLMMFMESFVASDQFDTFVDALHAEKDDLTRNTDAADSGKMSSTDEDSYADRVSSYLIDINDESSQEELPLTTIMFNTFSDLKNWAQDKPWERLDNDDMMREFKSIVDKNFEKASEHAKNIKDLFMGSLAWLMSSNLNDINDESSQEELPLTTIMFNTFSDLKNWSQDKPWERLDNDGMMREFKSIVDKNFEKASEHAKNIKDLFMGNLAWLISSEHYDSIFDAFKAMKQQVSSNLNDESSRELIPLRTIMFNTFSDLKAWANDKPWTRLDTNGMMKEFRSIVDKNFEKASPRAKYLKDLFMEHLEWLISSDQFDNFIDLFKALKNQLVTSSDEDASSEIPVDLNDMEKQYEVDAITTPNETDEPEESSYDDGQSPSNTQIQPSVTYEKILADWQSWKENAGKNVTYADQMKYLRDLLLQSLSSLNATDRESATNAINLINSELEKMNNTTQNTGSGTKTMNNSSSTGSTNSNVQTSAKTKTADGNISPEFMSLVLSGALSGIVVSLKKNKE